MLRNYERTGMKPMEKLEDIDKPQVRTHPRSWFWLYPLRAGSNLVSNG